MENLNQTIENLLQQFTQVIGEDFYKYKNHVYRVFLNCVLMDNEKSNESKYAIAAVFHDIGIWTNHTIDYLDPSVEQLKIYLRETSKLYLEEEISLMINWHHKITTYQGAHGQTVETFRKADWIDVSLGLLSFGFDKNKINANRKLFPNLRFHRFLIKKIAKNFLRHPLNPLPMFKK